MKIIWKLAGTALIVGGRLAKYRPAEWLGYYLQGSGKRRTMPPEWNNALTDINPFDIRYGRGWYTSVESRIFNSVGKFKVRQYQGYLIMLDYYMFYPTCRYEGSHGRGCGCSDRTWSRVFLLSVPLPTTLGVIDTTIKLGLWEVKIEQYQTSRRRTIEVSVEDRFFADKGRPFYTVGRIKL